MGAIDDSENSEQVRRSDLGKRPCDDCLGVGVRFDISQYSPPDHAGNYQAMRNQCPTCRGRGYMALILQRDGGHPTVVSFDDLLAGAQRRYDEGKLSRKSLDVVIAFCAPPRRG